MLTLLENMKKVYDAVVCQVRARGQRGRDWAPEGLVSNSQSNGGPLKGFNVISIFQRSPSLLGKEEVMAARAEVKRCVGRPVEAPR